jgi:CRP-like cAMP-binding protein
MPDARVWGRLFGESTLDADEIQALNRLATSRRLDAGDTVFCRGDVAKTLVLLVQGDAVLGGPDAHGQFRTERHLQGPAWLDPSAAWLGEPHAHDARALGPVSVVELDCAQLCQAIDLHPVLARRLVRALAREAQTLAQSKQSLMHQNAPARWAAWLLAHYQPVAEAPGRGLVQLPLRKRDIASQLAVTPETLSRMMRSLTAQGVITVAGYTVHVHDRAALARIAGA